ncbi:MULTISPECIES: TetR/AcrR family transcriptional regulator [Microvirga]|uniref:TetR/AcrR family transcriptional regulator n=1 Tax=Microvirga TaxID=186650 RepID=UPI001D0005C1|nr:TetR/AcrR family transcriptional regulator [Microvirga lenta]MCB5177433.1 TetR/AcrR family transcriptional regulator [Microvirga lenta]
MKPARSNASEPDAKAPRRRLSPVDRRQQILDAAIAYFSEVGFDGGTRALAKKLGVTQPLIYRYFPSKEDLIREVYNEVYLGRWQAEWEGLISDRRLPLRERLVTFYLRYTEVVFASEWMRIYLFSGLRGLEINQWWITFVEERILRRICEEIRFGYGLPGFDVLPIQEAEIDLYWMFHGGIFYYGMRRHVYQAAPHLPLQAFLELSVDSLLKGLPATIGAIVGEPSPASP